MSQKSLLLADQPENLSDQKFHVIRRELKNPSDGAKAK
jgi:hypothetical protein